MRARGSKGAKAEGGGEDGSYMDMEHAMSRKGRQSREDLRKKRAQPNIMQPEERGLSPGKAGGDEEPLTARGTPRSPGKGKKRDKDRKKSKKRDKSGEKSKRDRK